MKLVLFTPCNRLSAIGRVSDLVRRSLVGGGHEVSIICSDGKRSVPETANDFGCQVIAWTDSNKVVSLANQADAVIYQIGNSYEFHRGCLEYLPRVQGIVCLHDFYLGHLFLEWSRHHRKEAENILRAWYGDDVAQKFFNYPNAEAFIDGTVEASPMTEWVCSMALGVVTHSSWGTRRVLTACPGPVYVVPLCYENVNQPDNVRANDGKFRILTIGHVNQNKRAASVIRAIGSSHILRPVTIYNIVGKVQAEMELELRTLARDHGVSVAIGGEVEDYTLAKFMAESDVISCLRWPSLESASASLIEAMLFGKPTIVTDTGFYSELPNSCVEKIDPRNEIHSIKKALEHLYLNPGKRNDLGEEARTWARATFSPEIYATRLVDMAVSLSKIRPTIDAARFFTDMLGAWGATERIVNLEDTVGPLGLFNL